MQTISTTLNVSQLLAEATYSWKAELERTQAKLNEQLAQKQAALAARTFTPDPREDAVNTEAARRHFDQQQANTAAGWDHDISKTRTRVQILLVKLNYAGQGRLFHVTDDPGDIQWQFANEAFYRAAAQADRVTWGSLNNLNGFVEQLAVQAHGPGSFVDSVNRS